MSIFRAYDIRGIYPQEINNKIAYNIAKAFVLHIKPKTVLVARDMRNSSPSLHKSVVAGLFEQGADVVDIGLASSDLFYFASYYLKTDAGIMITASHNPGEYNGLKMVREKAIPITLDNGGKQIKRLTEHSMPKGTKKGKVKEKKNLLKEYVAATRQYVDYSIIKDKKVVFDAGNGMATVLADPMFTGTKLSVIKMNFKLDGNFPGRGPNPLLNHKDIQKQVIKEKADLGVTWDGDTDRVFFIDEKGNFIPGDFITGLLSQYMLKKYPNSAIVYDLRASHYVPDMITQSGGQALINRVGHSFIKQRMRKEKAVFAGEVSGHYYYKHDDLYAEHGYLPALHILEMMCAENKPLSELLAGTALYHISGEINFKVKDKEHMLRLLEMQYSDGKRSKIDGLSVEYADWHFNIRPSNTEPFLRLNLEANSEKLLQKKLKEIKIIIK